MDSASVDLLDHGDFLAIDDLLDYPFDFADASPSDPHLSSAISAASSSSISASSSSSSSSAPPAAPPPLPQLHFQSPPFVTEELCVPSDDLANLEWLSDFVEASFSSSGSAPPANYSLADLASGSSIASGLCNSTVASPAMKSAPPPPELRGVDACSAAFDIPSLSAPRHPSSSPISVLESSAYKSPSSSSSSKGKQQQLVDDVEEFDDIMFEDEAFPSSPSDAAAGVPARARSKRGRSAACFWNTRILSQEASESILLQQQKQKQKSAAAAMTAASHAMFSSFYEDDDGENSGGGGESDSTDDEEYYGDGDEEEEEEKRRRYAYAYYERRQSRGASGGGGGGGGGRGKKCSREAAAGDREEEVIMAAAAPRKRAGRGLAAEAAEMRKCLHCATQKTPQWRAGPMGPKTLCNACGVRYKSGRLCPEYRPAASPTFVDALHSNSHRKVMEMRRQKGFIVSAAPPPPPPPPPPLRSAAASPLSHTHPLSFPLSCIDNVADGGSAAPAPRSDAAWTGEPRRITDEFCGGWRIDGVATERAEYRVTEDSHGRLRADAGGFWEEAADERVVVI